jgi:hypothetical protein
MSTLQRGIGIKSTESTFNLTHVCSKFSGTISDNNFNNLYYGVKTSNTVDKGNIWIRGCNFNNSYRSIYLLNSKSAIVLNNNVEVIAYDPYTASLPYGIYLDGGSGFKVENNILAVSEPGPAGTFGIIVNETGSFNNEVYRNIFDNMTVSAQAQGKNYGYSPDDMTDLGLKFLCNEFEGMQDIRVTISNNIHSVGIASAQEMLFDNGYGTWLHYPAGNDFTSEFQHQDYWDYDNTDGDNPNGLYYYYEDNASYRSEPTYINKVLTVSLSQSNTCPDRSSSPFISKTQLTTDLTAAQLELNSAKVLLNIWRDGGEANLEQEVATTQPWEVYLELNELLANSPYLSDEVLLAAIENSAFTSLMIKLIMVANPQASRNNDIMEAIYNRVPEMPESYIEEIEAGEDAISQLDLLENDVATDNHALRMIVEDIKRGLREDTTSSSIEDSLLFYYFRNSSLRDMYDIAALYLQRGEFEEMNDLLNDLSSNYDFNEEQNHDYEQFTSLFDVAEEIFQYDEFDSCLTANDLQLLEGIKNDSSTQASKLALSLLNRVNRAYSYDELVVPFDTSQIEKSSIESRYIKVLDDMIKIYPNPSNGYFNVEYSISGSKNNDLNLEIYDATGRRQYSKLLLLPSGIESIDVSQLSNGTYSLSIISEGKLISSKKFTILK